MSLSNNIKKRREELKLSQEYVAEKLGVSRQAVSKWETEQSEPNAANLAQLAELLETTLSELTAENCGEKNTEEKDPDFILHMNLSLLAISMQAGMLYYCTEPFYQTVGSEKTIDYVFTFIQFGMLFLCSLWMSRNLKYEKNFDRYRKNTIIELIYCSVQLAIALCTYYFELGAVGLALIIAVLLFYVLYINPKYMNRPFGKKQRKQ